MAGRPSGPTEISGVILNVQDLTAVDISPRELYALSNDKRQWLQWLATHRLIRNTAYCAHCELLMSLISRHNCNDGFCWRCRRCKSCCSVRTGSFFTNSDLSTDKILMIMYYWLVEVKMKHVMLFEGLCCDTVVNYNKFFRKECHDWLQRNNNHLELGGFDANGQSMLVEVGESYFLHRKYHRGQFRHGQWVVGLIERCSGRCWLEIVERRDAAILEGIICDHVLPGTTIVTGAWQGYNNIGRLNGGIYDHAVVDPLSIDIHTHTIEGLWMQAKRKLRYQAGTNQELFRTYLEEFQWRYNHKEHVFGHYLKLLCSNFNI